MHNTLRMERLDVPPIITPKTTMPPASNNTVRVRAIDTTTRMVCDADCFLQPPIRGHEKLNLKTFAFLVEHRNRSTGELECVLFDCGSRKDYWNGAPQACIMIGGHVPALEVDYGVDEILTQSGFDLHQLKSIVWSHWHWDHVGDASQFPSSVEIVVGPGFTENFVSETAKDKHHFLLKDDLRLKPFYGANSGRHVHEPKFETTVCGFTAHDYFGDGSFYLLDVPGHTIGHICGFARTTSDSFILMGADACHFPGVLRPNIYAPLSEDRYQALHLVDVVGCCETPSKNTTINDSNQDETGVGSERGRTAPFYNISDIPGTAYTEPKVAQCSVDKLQVLDARPDILICLAHDLQLPDMLPLFNDDATADMNDWRVLGVKERWRWCFLGDLPKADGSPGRAPLVADGLHRDGKLIHWSRHGGFRDADEPHDREVLVKKDVDSVPSAAHMETGEKNKCFVH